jgi:hypothetical protein
VELTEDESAMVGGALGSARRRAIEHQLKLGRYFRARDFVPVARGHIMADTESLGEAGIA